MTTSKRMPHLAVDFMNQDHDAIYQQIQQAQALLQTASESSSPASVQQITQILQSLLQACKAHFEREEQEMQACHFPQLTEHQQEHQLILQVSEEAFETWQNSLEIEPLKQYLQLTLPTWFIGHVDSMDDEAALFISRAENSN